MLDKHASLLNAGHTQNDDPVAPPKKKKKAPPKKVKLEVIDKVEVNDTNTGGKGKKRDQSKKDLGGKPPKRKR